MVARLSRLELFDNNDLHDNVFGKWAKLSFEGPLHSLRNLGTPKKHFEMYPIDAPFFMENESRVQKGTFCIVKSIAYVIFRFFLNVSNLQFSMHFFFLGNNLKKRLNVPFKPNSVHTTNTLINRYRRLRERQSNQENRIFLLRLWH